MPNPRTSQNGESKKDRRPCKRCGMPFNESRVQCPSCSYMNIDVPFISKGDGTILLSDAAVEPAQRIATGDWDACWGHHIDDAGKTHVGIVTCSVTLLGGAPGAGKSTLALMLANSIAKQSNREVLYISGEEGDGQIRSRADRLKLQKKSLIRLVPIGRATDLSGIISHYNPAAIIVDSLPTICPDMGKAVEFAVTIKEWSEKLKCPAIIIDHVTKEEEFAGLQALQHAVDTTLLFTVYEDDGIRELRTVKNRNGPSGVRVFFDMTELGLILSEDLDEEDDDDDEDD